MQQSLKQKLLAEKSAKHRALALKTLSSEGGIDRVFAGNTARPNPQQFADMCVASKYGGADPLFAGGDTFAIESIVQGLNTGIFDYKSNGAPIEGCDTYDMNSMSLTLPTGVDIRSTDDEAAIDDKKLHLFTSIAPHCWGNVLLVYVFNKTLLSYLDEMSPQEFAFNASIGLYVGKRAVNSY